MLIRIGFTQSDLANGYSSFSGYREGAEQKELTLDVADYESAASIEWIAEQVFMATNHPEPESIFPGETAGVIYAALTEQVRPGTYFRSLSVGDTVELPERDERVAVESFGFTRIFSEAR